jgi:hypothetical protein
MRSGDEPDEQEVRIFDLPGEQKSRPLRAASPTPSRKSKYPLLALIMLAGVTLLVVSSGPAAREILERSRAAQVLPSPTAPVAPAESQFYVQGNPPWGSLLIDGRSMRPLPMRTTAPLRLSPGRHTLLWRAAPFNAQSCTTSVPPDFADDTCVDNSAVQLEKGVYVSIITFNVSLDSLPSEQRSSLIGRVQAALDRERSSTIVQPGEDYVEAGTCRAGYPLRTIFKQCVVAARQPLRATLGLRLDTNASANRPCYSPDTQQPCAFLGQSCHRFCPLIGGEPGLWNAGAAVLGIWTFTAFDGEVVANSVPDDANEEYLVPLRLMWGSDGWQVRPLLGNSPGATPQPYVDDPTCQPFARNTNLLSNATATAPVPMQFSYVAAPALADGCAIATAPAPALEAATPQASQGASYCLYRFGVALAASKLAHRYWPFMPVADTYEEDLARQLAPSS